MNPKTKNLCKATIKAYPNPNHFYNLQLKDVRTQLVWVIACFILVVSSLSDAIIENLFH